MAVKIDIGLSKNGVQPKFGGRQFSDKPIYFPKRWRSTNFVGFLMFFVNQGTIDLV